MNGTVNNRVVMNGSGNKTVAVSGDSDKKVVVGGGVSVGSILKGDPGADGVTFTPHVDAEGNLSWTNDGNLENPQSVNIKGRDGADGAAGPKGDKGDKGEPGESGASSWNDLQDKPFGEKQAFEPIIFPNNITELENSTYYDLTPFVGQYLGVNKLYVWRIQTTTPERNIFDGSTASTENHEHGDERTEFFKIDTTVVGINWCDFYEIKHTSGHLTNEISAEWHLYLLAVYDENNFGLPCGVYMSGFIHTNSGDWIGLSNILFDTYGKIKISKPIIITIDEKYLPDNIGSTTSWNDLEDKPFYSEMVEGAAEFDGDLTGKEYYEAGDDMILVKMSDTPLTMDELIGSTVILKHPTEEGSLESTITEGNVMKDELDDANYMLAAVLEELDMPVIYVICGDLSSVEVPLSEGTYYVMIQEGPYTHSLSCLGGMQEKVHKIDKKYLPDTVLMDNEVPHVIVDVAELPTENIDTNAIYRLTNRATYYQENVIIGDFDIHCVEKLPKVGKPYYDNETHKRNLYYNVKNGNISYFNNNTWKRSYSTVSQTVTDFYDSTGILIDSRIFIYNNGWIELNSEIESGSGLYSVKMNSTNTASGECSCAEGYNTIASGANSHSEGGGTTASGFNSHAEGRVTIASHEGSHAEGQETHAEGLNSHAEGWRAHAEAYYSHAEGTNTHTKGYVSHAEGNYTIASGACSHVQGKYNIEDTEDKYAHIVGNGTFKARSNAHTLDWDGNAWFAGTVEGTAIILKSSTPDSTKRFKLTVDDNGVISATELT